MVLSLLGVSRILQIRIKLESQTAANKKDTMSHVLLSVDETERQKYKRTLFHKIRNNERLDKITQEDFLFCGYELQSDELFISKLVQENGRTLQFACPRFRNNKEIVMLAVAQRRFNGLQYVSEELQDDRDVVLLAVQHDGRALEYASDRLRSDKEIVLVAVQQDGEALEYASETSRDDPLIVLEAVRQHGWSLRHA